MSVANGQRQVATQGDAATAGDLRLRCPRCKGFVTGLSELEFQDRAAVSCTGCQFTLRYYDGVVSALLPERAPHFERFIREYQAVRDAEGRGSERPDYYFALPYRDLSGRLQSQWLIRARTFEFLERRILGPLASRFPGGMAILDLGAGNGWMSYRLALRGHKPAAVDLLTNEKDGLGAAIHYQQKLPELFPRFQAELDRLPFEDGQFDVAIFNASFHYSEDYAETLGEAIRCLRPGGRVIIADTAWYRREESGREMVAERQQAFVRQHGFRSDGIRSQEYLTDQRLATLSTCFRIRWTVHSPFYGLRWAMRPLIAKLQGRRTPSRFRIYVAEVNK